MIFYLTLIFLLFIFVSRPNLLLSAPSLVTFFALLWVLPQVATLENLQYWSSDPLMFLIYVSLCIIGLVIGFFLSTRKALNSEEKRELRSKFTLFQWKIAAVIFLLIGFVANFMMRSYDTSQYGGQWTGSITVFALLGTTSSLAFVVYCLIWRQTGSRFDFSMILLSSVFLFISAFVFFRREELFELAITVACVYYLNWREKKISRGYVILFAVALSIFVNNISIFRSDEFSLDSALELYSSTLSGKAGFFESVNAQSSEIRMAEYDFAHMQRSGDLELFKNLSNAFVHQYVPAFIFGREFKDSLFFETLERSVSSGKIGGAFVLGSTRTGFSDSYRSLGFLGFLFYVIIGCILGVAYRNRRKVEGILWYVALLPFCLKAISHSTSEFFVSAFFVFILIKTVLLFSKFCSRFYFRFNC